MDLKTYDREQFNALMAAGHSREHFKLSGAGIETWYAPKGMSSGADHFGPFVELKFEQLSVPVTAVQSTWNGPEDGLPPVGTKVTIENPQGYGLTCDEDDWLGPQLKVVMNYRNDFGVDLVVVERDDGAAQVFRASMCRTIRTAEQLAAEEREKRVAEFAASIKLAGWEDPLILAAWLDGQGYRKVQP